MAVAKENKVVHGNDLTYITQKYKEYFVAKEAGKGLSTNDYTTAEKTKLAGIEAGAQVNDIEVVKVNGTAQTPDANKAVNITVPTKLSDLTDDVLQGEYVPLAGGTMDKNAELGFVDYDSSMMPPLNTAYTHNTTTLEGTGMEVEQSKYTPASQMASGNAKTVDTTTKYDVNSIAKTVKTTEGGSTTTNTYTLTLPSKNGTVATTSDIPTVAGVYAPLASPSLTGTPTAPTAAAGTNNTQVATTAFVTNAVTTAIDSITGISFNTDYATYAALVAAGTAAQKAGVIYLIPNSGSSPNIKDEYVWTGSSYELLGTTEVDLSRFDEDLTATEIEQLLALNS